jgi:signal transduction histidine kinase
MKKSNKHPNNPSVNTKIEIKSNSMADFVNAVSHDLKNPLASIKAYAQITKKKLSKTDDKEVVQFIEKIETQADRAIQLITELLDTSKISEGKIVVDRELFRLDKLIKETVEDLQITVKTHSIVEENIIEKNIKADKERIRRVLLNLLTNAVKYSPDADKVIVRMSVDKKNVIVSVQDFGVGIPVSKQKPLFDPYFRVKEGKKTEATGYGLGLPIVKRIVEAHDGKVWLESKKGKGSTFFFSLEIE